MITLRPATIDDLPLLLHWDEQPHVIESDPSDDWEWEIELLRNPDWREQLVAEADGRPIGFIQIIDPKQRKKQREKREKRKLLANVTSLNYPVIGHPPPGRSLSGVETNMSRQPALWSFLTS